MVNLNKRIKTLEATIRDKYRSEPRKIIIPWQALRAYGSDVKPGEDLEISEEELEAALRRAFGEDGDSDMSLSHAEVEH